MNCHLSQLPSFLYKSSTFLCRYDACFLPHKEAKNLATAGFSTEHKTANTNTKEKSIKNHINFSTKRRIKFPTSGTYALPKASRFVMFCCKNCCTAHSIWLSAIKVNSLSWKNSGIRVSVSTNHSSHCC